jgi:hypothetical protein
MWSLIIIVGALLQSTTAEQPPVPADPAAFSGRVLEDGTGAPIAGAQVTLNPLRPGPPVPPFSRPRTATADQTGRYEFVDLEPGRYRVNAQKVGFAMPLGNASGVQQFELKSGERREGIDVRLQRGGVIAGRVLDGSGEPLADARVMAWRRPPSPADGRPRQPFGNGTNGTTVQFRENTGTHASVTVNEANVTGLRVVVQRPAR